MKLGDFNKSKQWLDNAKTYSGYTLEAIVHCRMHTAIRQMDKKNKLDTENDSGQSSAESDEQLEKTNGSIRTIWNELSRRFYFVDKREEMSEKEFDFDNDIVESKTKF